MHKIWLVEDDINITTLLIQSTQFHDLSVVSTVLLIIIFYFTVLKIVIQHMLINRAKIVYK